MEAFACLPEPVLYALATLSRIGREAALVGGCVRDTLMGRTPGDYDIATSALPEETLRAFAGDRVVPTGLKHGTVTLVRNGMGMEITTFREDGAYADMRRPDSVTFTGSLSADVLRRDFTMNALAWEQDRGLIDEVGGREDIRRRLIRCVGAPDRRFAEDALRMLRALRFSAQLDFAIDPETRESMRRLWGNVSHVAPERVRQEMEKLLPGPGAQRVLTEYGTLFSSLLPGAAFAEETVPLAARRLAAVQTDGLSEGVSRALCWAALYTDAGADAATASLRALRVDEKTVHAVAAAIDVAASLQDGPDEYMLRTAVGENGFDAAWDGVRLRFAFCAKQRDSAAATLCDIRDRALPCALRDLAVNGSDLRSIGISGIKTGDTLRRLLDGVRSGRLPNEKDALLRSAEEGNA